MKWPPIIKQTGNKLLVKLGHYEKPSFMVIGAQKAGTSALFRILNQHPNIQGSTRKEIHFFDKHKSITTKDLADYHSHFVYIRKPATRVMTFEATPNYLPNPNAPELLAQYNPNLKLIAVLRNPAERALSAWSMFHYQRDPTNPKTMYDPRSFRQAIEQEMDFIQHRKTKLKGPRYIIPGLYVQHLNRYLKFFPTDQLLILEHNRYKTHFDESMSQILDFLQLPRISLQNEERHVRKVKNHHDYSEELAMLSAFFHPYNEELYQLLGKRFNWSNREPNRLETT